MGLRGMAATGSRLGASCRAVEFALPVYDRLGQGIVTRQARALGRGQVVFGDLTPEVGPVSLGQFQLCCGEKDPFFEHHVVALEIDECPRPTDQCIPGNDGVAEDGVERRGEVA